MSEPSQAAIVLEVLEAADGGWVGMPTLAAASGSLNIHSRVNQLRNERGLRIENRQRREPGSARKISEYRLITPDPSPAT